MLEFSDMDQYMMVDVEPNLKRLLGYQQEDLLEYFTGDDRQLTVLRRHFHQYRREHQSQIARYERAFGRIAD